MWKGGKRAVDRAQSDALERATMGGLTGSLGATVISAFALLFSGYSFYESVMRAPSLATYVPPQIQYTDPDRPDNPFEVFIIPITLANDGARTGTILSMDLDVRNPRTGQTKRFYAAREGSWGTNPLKSFAPVSLPGKGSFSAAIQFFPRQDETVPRILDFEAGDYEFKVTLNTAEAKARLSAFRAKTVPLTFKMQANKLDYRNFTGSGTIPMWAADYKPAAAKPQ